MTEIPQIDSSVPSSNPDAVAMALTGDTMTDLKNVAAEMGIKLDSGLNVVEAQPETKTVATPAPQPVPAQQPQAAKADVEVPAKFQNEDGTPNVEKIGKSTKSVEEMLAYYKTKEREANQAQNRVNNPPLQALPPTPQPHVPQAGFQLTQFERQAAIDILADAQALGIQMTDSQAILQARADIRMAEAKHAAELSATEDIRRELNETRMAAELEGLIKHDGTLLTKEVADRVLAIKSEQGFKTYRQAYIFHRGEQDVAQRTGQVQTPIPTGTTAKAPPTPVGPVTRVQRTVDTSNPKSLTDDQLEAEVRKLYPGARLGQSRL